MNKIAIMQPTYLPWPGYFSLMKNVDTFVLLDSVQFERRSWQQRNRIRTKDGERLLTIPVKSKGLRDQPINKVKVEKNSNFKDQHLGLIKQSYSKADYFKNNFEAIFSNSFYNEDLLCEISSKFILKIKEVIGIKSILVKSSELNSVGNKDALLASICKELGSKEYISPIGSKIYLENSKEFLKNEINITYFEYKFPIYKQLYNPFISHLSIIDMIFNCGIEKSIEYL